MQYTVVNEKSTRKRQKKCVFAWTVLFRNVAPRTNSIRTSWMNARNKRGVKFVCLLQLEWCKYRFHIWQVGNCNPLHFTSHEVFPLICHPSARLLFHLGFDSLTLWNQSPSTGDRLQTEPPGGPLVSHLSWWNIFKDKSIASSKPPFWQQYKMAWLSESSQWLHRSLCVRPVSASGTLYSYYLWERVTKLQQ